MNDFDRNNLQLWKWGIIYYNPDDSTVIVPKRTGIGWTFNYAHLMAYVWTAAIFLGGGLIAYGAHYLSATVK